MNIYEHWHLLAIIEVLAQEQQEPDIDIVRTHHAAMSQSPPGLAITSRPKFNAVLSGWAPSSSVISFSKSLTWEDPVSGNLDKQGQKLTCELP